LLDLLQKIVPIHPAPRKFQHHPALYVKFYLNL
jgi:hypothetical protein